MKNLKAKDLSGILAVEGTLARQESSQMKESLPPGHPLLQAVQEEETRAGDLAGLPDNHPLKVALREARDRMVASEATEKPEEQAIKKAKRIDEREHRRKQLEAEDEAKEVRLEVYGVINNHIDEAMGVVDKLLATIRVDASVFGEDRYSMMKVARLHRLMLAVRAGLTDSKLRAREA